MTTTPTLQQLQRGLAIATETVIDALCGVADGAADTGQCFGRAFEALTDEAAGMLGNLARQPLAAAAEAVGDPCCGAARTARR